jgi:acyl carrier protein
MLLIADVEAAFGIKFKLKELNKMRNVGDMIDIILTKA